MTSDSSTLIGKKVQIPDHFPSPVSIEAVKFIGTAVLLQARTSEGRLEETVLTNEEIEKLLEQVSQQQKEEPRAAGEELRLLIESNRIRLAYCYDPYFAVSLSGIQSLPHQMCGARPSPIVKCYHPFRIRPKDLEIW